MLAVQERASRGIFQRQTKTSAASEMPNAQRPNPINPRWQAWLPQVAYYITQVSNLEIIL